MSYEYSENILVQESAGKLLADELGWDVKFAFNTEVLEKDGKDGTFGRKSYKEILLIRYFQEALKRLNPWIKDEQVSETQRILEARLSTASPLQINEEKYFLIRDGIPITIKKPDGTTDTKKVLVIDFQNVENNYFLAIKELKIHGDTYRRRTDIVGFVNGIPLLFVELKKTTVDVQNAYVDNYTDYQSSIPQLFYYNAFVMLSNGVEAKVGTLGSKFEFFHEWKRLSEEEQGNVELETMLRGICKKENLLDLFDNFILYDHSEGRTAKILARNHQYLGVNRAITAYADRANRDGKLGVFWHTQGSGKSYSMLFLTQKIRRKFEGSPTFVVLTDRDDLNSQISDTFENCGLLGTTKASQYIASSGSDLIKKLQANPSFIFTLIQKFNKEDVAPIIPDHDIIVISDEAHRSQYGLYADNMMRLLPKALRIGFTGTPLFLSGDITKRTFGDYISIYDFKRAVEDGATVPLFYENRGEKIHIDNPEITNKILDAIENAELDVNQQDKLEKEFAKEIHLMTAEPRLRAIAQDFVTHYSDLWTSGKAMFVCLNKVTCVRMYNFVKEYWQKEIEALKDAIKNAPQDEAKELEKKLHWMQETEMAVVISQEQNELKTFEDWGLDIIPHRKKMEARKLDKEFKDAENPFRIAFVCAMWLTGFDVKCLSCLYLDKPLKDHTLMQAIARANRVNEGKSNGLIIDYIGIVKALRKALANYTVNVESIKGSDPTIDKEELIVEIKELIETIKAFLSEQDFVLQDLIDAQGFRKIEFLQNAANAVCKTLQIKKTYSTYASELNRLMKYTNRDDITDEQRREYYAIAEIYNNTQKKRRHADTSSLMKEIHDIISEYVQIEEHTTSSDDSRKFDISAIDFDMLGKEFTRAKNKSLILRDLTTVMQQQLDRMLRDNPKRIDYYERYQEIIENYNKEQDRATIEKTFADLMKLANEMDEEEKRYIREGFNSDEELSIYDLLFRDDLSKNDIKKIKEVAITLLQKIKEKIAEYNNCFDKTQGCADVQKTIREILYMDLPESYANNIETVDRYRDIIYEYVYTRYSSVA